MRGLKKLSAFLLSLMLCVGVVSTPVNAASDTKEQDGLQVTLTTDKEEYSDGEEIKLTLTVKNTNKEAVTSLNLEEFISDGYELTEESIEALKQLVALGGNDEESIPITVVKKETSSLNPDPKPEEPKEETGNTPASDTSALTSPKTDDENNIALWAVVFIAGLAGVAAVWAIRNKKGKQALAIMLCVAMASSTFMGASTDVFAAEKKMLTVSKTVKYAGESVTFTANISYIFESTEEVTPTPDEEPVDEYKLVWSDEFNGTELNRDDWNVELHDPGWVNAEWQEYVDSTENIAVKDGKLVITPIQTKNEDGTYSYTSGRINTQNKQTFTYGKFEARVKVPTGMGYLPAFWLMANDENLYGQWPRCGEIDIMEVMGQSTDTAHGTIHYGNPHNQNQGTYVLENGTFADDFHTFAVEWEPGKITWSIDGVEYYSTSDWFSATEGQGELTYPAPFDQPFYVILNLAVGGSWVGYPEHETFVSDTYEVDYVRVYQKDSYDENVQKPSKEVVLREPDANGNYVINGDFAVAEDLSAESADWAFMLNGGEATAEINNNELSINTTNAGTLDYSVQLVQPNLPMQKGATYKLTFDAYADEARTMIVDISAPDNNWIRYLADSKIDLTTEKKTYTFEFTMTDNDDANGRLEFNLGNQGSIAGVHISNVKLVKTAFEEIKEDTSKTVLTDGNHVYNGQFQEGENRLGYWTVNNNSGAEVSVTDLADGRRLKVVIPESVGADATVTVSQEDLALGAGSEYEISYDAEGSVVVTVEGTAYNSGDKITANDNNDDNDIVLTFKGPGTYYIDNVRIVEDSLIKNGSFSAGLAGFEPFADSSISSGVTWVVDSLTEDNAVDYTINNTGSQDWHIQLKQEDITLEKGQWYRLTLDAKSSIDRAIMVAIQRNGNIPNNDWTPYVQDTIDLTENYQTFEFEFQMMEETDLQSVLSISMGAVGGTQITEQHRVVMDNINLEKIDAPEQEEIVAGENLILNPTFANNGENWESGITSPGTGTYTYNAEEGSVTFDITNVGTEDWHAQLKTFGINLEQGESYKVSFKASSTADRSMSVNVMSTSYAWYGGTSAALTSEPQAFEFTFDMTTDNANAGLFFSMGKIAGEDTPASVITISDVSVVKVDSTADDSAGDDTTGDDTTEDTTTPAGENLLQNPTSESDMTPWTDSSYGGAHTASVSGNSIIYDITDAGTLDSHIQLKQEGVALENGATYTVSFKATSTVARTIKSDVMSTSYAWYGGITAALEAGVPQEITYSFTMTEEQADGALFISMGKIDDPTPASTITLSDFNLIKN